MARDNPGGRPLKFKSAAELEKKIDEYFDECAQQTAQIVTKDGEVVEVNRPRIPTMSGLAVYLDTTRRTLCDYHRRDRFCNAISRARARVEAAMEDALFHKETCNGAKFALSNNFSDWAERTDNSHNVKGNVSVQLVSYAKGPDADPAAK